MIDKRQGPSQAGENAIDGFSQAEIQRMAFESVIQARCSDCDDIQDVEPDARGYDCHSCGAQGTVTSPLVKLGLI